jgi:arylsulfatase A-like enzyme
MPRSASLLLILFGIAGCAPPTPARPLPSGRPAVVIVSIDGLRADAIASTHTPHLSALLREGAYSLDARTITPSHTLPSHTSMLTGVPPTDHGITWNSDRTDETGMVSVPTVFALAKAAGLRTAAFFGKAKFQHLVVPGSLDAYSVPRFEAGIVLAPDMVARVRRHLRRERPDLLFVHLADPDVMGHAMGWSTAGYRWGVRRADAAVGKLRAALRRAYGDDVVLIVTADHGGEGREHGKNRAGDEVIPWIVAGPGVIPGQIDGEIRTFDTAATALAVLGVAVPREWSGRPVAAAFGPGEFAVGAGGR